MTARKINRTLAATLLAGSMAMASNAFAAPNVVTTIAPVHSITQAIMGDVGKAHMLVPQNASPHSADFRPSQAKALQKADLVIWIGPDIETFLIDPLKTLPKKAHLLELMDAKDIIRLPLRSGNDWEKHSHGDHDDHHDEHAHDKHDDHDHKKHDDHAHDKHDDHDHKKHDEHAHDKHDDHDHKKHDEHAHDKHDDHGHEKDRMDNHIWLDPQNGIAMAKAIANELSEHDPDNAATYTKNKDAFIAEMNKVIAEGKTDLANLGKRPFLVFHDAYHYLEERFGLEAVGSIMLQPGVMPGAARVKQIREKLSKTKATCLFTEPQFSDKIVPVLVENTTTKLGALDPIGRAQKAGPQLYADLIRYNIKSLKTCLSTN
ncbi:MAG: zinc ABC transporter substrate-binding protein [Cohaesibacter sp.]|nr:zinc ABC transporter substrate-binding protein [Cohaesibacter sp.]